MSPRRWVSLIAAAVAVAGVASLLRSPARQAGRPNVLLIVVDSLRADALGAYGSTAGLTPALDRLAADSRVYERAYAASSWTVPSVASLFTGQYPSEHQVATFAANLPADRLTLAEVLAAHGIRSAGYVANPNIAPVLGFGQGFDDYRLVGDFNGFSKGDADAVNRAAMEWAEHHRDGSAPAALYLHYMEPHVPYRAHPGLTAERRPEVGPTDAALNARVTGPASPSDLTGPRWRFSEAERARLIDLYDGEVRYVDQRIGELLAGLERAGALANTIVIVTADHGEEFGEHQIFGHGTSLYESVLRVPLIVRLPGGAAPDRVSRPVELAGLAPALLQELVGSVPPSFHIAPLPLRAAGAGRLAYSELLDTHFHTLRLHESAAADEHATLLRAPDGDAVAFDVRTDPFERSPLPPSPAVDALRSAAQQVRAGLAAANAPATGVLDEATRERLRGLGYLPDEPR